MLPYFSPPVLSPISYAGTWFFAEPVWFPVVSPRRVPPGTVPCRLLSWRVCPLCDRPAADGAGCRNGRRWPPTGSGSWSMPVPLSTGRTPASVITSFVRDGGRCVTGTAAAKRRSRRLDSPDAVVAPGLRGRVHAARVPRGDHGRHRRPGQDPHVLAGLKARSLRSRPRCAGLAALTPAPRALHDSNCPTMPDPRLPPDEDLATTPP